MMDGRIEQRQVDRLSEMGGGLYLAELKPGVYAKVSRTHLIRDIGNSHFFDEKSEAIHKLQRLLRKQGKCETCKARVFEECQQMAAE